MKNKELQERLAEFPNDAEIVPMVWDSHAEQWRPSTVWDLVAVSAGESEVNNWNGHVALEVRE